MYMFVYTYISLLCLESVTEDISWRVIGPRGDKNRPHPYCYYRYTQYSYHELKLSKPPALPTPICM